MSLDSQQYFKDAKFLHGSEITVPISGSMLHST